MALDDAMKAKIRQIFGIPQVGNGYNVHELATLFGPWGEEYDFTAVLTELDGRLTAAALVTETVNRITAVITDWDSIGSTSPLQIWKSSSGAEGVIVDYPQQRENIRLELSRLLGFNCPKGGFTPAPQGRIIR